MSQFFMRDAKNLPKFSAKAIAQAETKAKVLFFSGLFLTAGGVGTIEIGSLGIGLAVAAIGAATMWAGVSSHLR